MVEHEIRCSYIFKKGLYKDKKCNVIKCKLHINKTYKITKTPDKKHVVLMKMEIVKENKQEKPQLIEKIITKRLQNEETIKQKILQLDTSIANKTSIMKHYLSIKKLDDNTSEYYKNQLFIDQTLTIPWNKFYNIRNFIGLKKLKEIKEEDEDDTEYNHTHNQLNLCKADEKLIFNDIENKILIKNFIEKIKQAFNNEIHGMDNIKNEIINHICKFITNPFSEKNNIALYGNAGVCKTKFVKILSSILGLKMKIISLGGMKDSSYLLGHHFTYQESQCGIITQSIIESQIMNPIIYFDELDKVSSGEHGQDIYSVLANITDPTVNSNFKDHYFTHLNIDLSKVFYIFTFNDLSKINKILLDRLNVIYIENPSKKDKVIILKSHCLNEIIQNIGLKVDIIIEDNCYNKIIDYVDNNIDLKISSGIRESVRILEKILLEINKELLLEVLYDNTNSLHILESRFDAYFEKLKPQFIFLLNQDETLPPSNMYI